MEYTCLVLSCSNIILNTAYEEDNIIIHEVFFQVIFVLLRSEIFGYSLPREIEKAI